MDYILFMVIPSISVLAIALLITKLAEKRKIKRLNEIDNDLDIVNDLILREAGNPYFSKTVYLRLLERRNDLIQQKWDIL